ncbi:phosphate binding protein [Teredinibacter turnerae T7901]|uniref:Phosphate binding protein n=1 Tax=Teredinibacter turnerae (strain ATCC 39867 / T7901) TaxID=377629 RepID=C5BJU4_TERTT|nr:PstS family phosphate ABC transporter substrate-binding protein [Teredinibacter turnerae]ACR13899.1 phosphate binding protein [Teredinibacter turnerae T7901]
MKKLLVWTFAAATTMAASSAFAARDSISIVGSSTVFPFSKVVAERFGRATKFKSPTVESTGTGGGFKQFCGGVGVNFPDMSNASRRIKQAELDNCKANGVTDIVEVLIGYDGIVIANSVKAKQMKLSRKDLFLALAKKVPNPSGGDTLVDNPYKTWKDVNPTLPAIKIEVLGPPPTSGTRDAFVELAMEGGCSQFSFIKAYKSSDKNRFKEVCHILREDGAFIEAGENDNLIVQKLNANPNALGIFGFSFLDQNADKVQASYVDGSLPTFDTIADGAYPVSRPLYFYVKKAHIGLIPGIEQFLAEFTSEKAWGDEGYLSEKGLIPLDEDRRATIAKRVKALDSLKSL